jgi:hypothetical protein
MALVGVIVGIILVVSPGSRDYKLPPYFWVPVAMAAFELIAFARKGGARGTVVPLDARLGGFVLAILLMVVIPFVSGG